ncbi:protein ALP1-like [Trematomus bernacchii]|uniref:protein ALP1-like n=1 Tax=Trematomus bernacchii TaxID=40690 RepID=UPI00146D62E3|nr:protein ALP1-like [Trematomus bernacchii]
MALVDSNYKFLYVDVGCNGRISDGGVFGGCSLQDALENRTFNIPAPAPLPASDQAVCYHIVADEAFPLKEYLMKPYLNRRLAVEQRIFNYRLSRARRVVENAFGILANRFRVFLTTINIQDTSCAQRTVAHTWRELLTRKDPIMALSQEAGDKTLTYGKPPHQ